MVRLPRVLNPFLHWIEAKGPWAPWLFLAVFVAASLVMIWRLEAMSASGFEGTVLGTLVMPYCSGMGNLIFAYILGRDGGSGADVMGNSLVNNVTDMTLVLGLPAVIWGMKVLPPQTKKRKTGSKAYELNRLSLLLTLLAVLFFTGTVWVFGRDGKIDFNEGLVLIGLFLFWQCFHVFEVLKNNVRQGKSLDWMLPFDLALLAVCAYAIYVSTDWLVAWVGHVAQGGFIKTHLDWISGWITVLPNAVLAFYYGFRGQPETVYTSQVGDAHISIPLCIGVYTMFNTMELPHYYQLAMLLLFGSTLVHLFFVGVFGRLPRVVGALLVIAYGYFLWKGLLG
ncbi:MAG: sodium:calcium symporter [Verrucomicrobiota bacterium]